VVRPGFISTEFIAAANSASTSVLAEPGPYAPYLAGFTDRVKTLHRVAGVPDDVARVVENALCAAHPKSHYAAPFHAKVFLLLKWLLPRRLFDWAVRMKA
jgi:hypothetical protein